jgi:hypothetical protein
MFSLVAAILVSPIINYSDTSIGATRLKTIYSDTSIGATRLKTIYSDTSIGATRLATVFSLVAAILVSPIINYSDTSIGATRLSNNVFIGSGDTCIANNNLLRYKYRSYQINQQYSHW